MKHLRIIPFIVLSGSIIVVVVICVLALVSPPVGNIFSKLCGNWVNITYDSEGRRRYIWDCMDERIYNQFLWKNYTPDVTFAPTIEAIVTSQSDYCSLFDTTNPNNPPGKLNAKITYPTSLSPRPEYVDKYLVALETETRVRLIAKVQTTGLIVWYLTKLNDGSCAWLQDIDVVFDENFDEGEIPWIIPPP